MTSCAGPEQVARERLAQAAFDRVAGQDAGEGAVQRNVPAQGHGGKDDYVAFKGGFELRSKWKLDEKLRSKWGLGRPETLVLTVGWRGE